MAQLLRYEDVSDLTGVPVATLRYMRHAGTGPRAFKLGGRVCFKRADIESWIEEQYAAS